MNRHFTSIATLLVIAIFFGFSAPLTVGVTYSLRKEDQRIKTELANFQQTIFDSLENSLKEALLNLEPAQIENAAQLVIHDQRIVSIKVYSSLYGMTLANLKKNRNLKQDQLLIQKREIEVNGEQLGYIEIAIDNTYHDAASLDARRNIIFLFAGMFICGIALIYPIIYFIIIKPTKRLMLQAKNLSAGDMSSSFKWQGNDELSELGNTLEKMRRELKLYFLQIQKLAVTDELTQIPNRRAFLNDAQKALSLSERYDRPFTIALMDIDHFKKVNDTYGHDMGDKILKDVATLITNMTRSTDIFARYGGEEFIICMPETNMEEAKIVTEKIREGIESHNFAHEQTLTSSIGLSTKSANRNLATLIQEADQAMYKAKKSGRNCVMIYSGS